MGQATPSDPYDPYVTDFSLSGTAFSAGETLSVTANVTVPLGNLTALEFGFYLQGTVTFFSAGWSGFGPGGTRVVEYSFTGDEIAGTYELMWIYTNSQNETMVASHQEYADITYPDGSPVLIQVSTDNAPAPNLRTSEVTASPPNPSVGDDVLVTVGVFNNGTANATNFTVAFYDDGFEVERWNVSGLASSRGTGAHTFHWTPDSSGNHTLTVVADVDDAVNESDELDNVQSVVVTVAPGKPDLVVASVTRTPAAPRVGDEVRINATVRNAGNATAGSSEVALRINGVERARTTIGGLAPNATTNVTFSITPTVAGTYNASIHADAAGNVSESNETNNNATFSFTVSPALRPDLKASFVVATPGSGTVGTTTNITGRFTNIGNVSAGGFIAELRVDGEPLATQWIFGLAPGANASISWNWVLTEGTHVVSLDVDSTGIVAESNEGNNHASTLVVGVPAVDVAMRIVSVEHEPLRTELGDAPHPFPRHVIVLEISSNASVALNASWSLRAEAQARFVAGASSTTLEVGNVSLGPGETRRLTIVWDPVGALGDIELVAQVALPGFPEPNLANNLDREADFVVVGGAGGIILPLP